MVVVEYWFANGSIFGTAPVHDIVFRGTSGFWEMLVFVLATSLVAATASYYLVERPVQRLRRRRVVAPVTELSGTGDAGSPQLPHPSDRAA